MPPDSQLTSRVLSRLNAEWVQRTCRRTRERVLRDSPTYMLRAPVVERLNFAVRGVPDGIATHAVQACHRGVARYLWQKTSIVVLAALQSNGLLLSHLHVAHDYHGSTGCHSARQCHVRQQGVL